LVEITRGLTLVEITRGLTLVEMILFGAFAHGAIYLIRDANNSLRARFVTTLLQYRSAIISHLSAITLFLGFHTLGLYVHNDDATRHVALSEGHRSRIVNPLKVTGRWKGSLSDEIKDTRSVESRPPSIMDRRSVHEALAW
jgi:Photosystem I psaA/psaB protein